MARFDVIVIGAGPAGLTAAGLLAKEGRSVLVLERSEHLGGRGLAVGDEGYKLNLGGHLLEDSGSGITRVFEQLGKQLPHGRVNSELPIWENGAWKSIRDTYAGTRGELKKAINALVETPYEALEAWDDRLERTRRRARDAAAGLVRGADPLPRAGCFPLHLAGALHRDEGARVRSGTGGARVLDERSADRHCGVLLQHDRARARGVAPGHEPVRRGRRDPALPGARRGVGRRDVREVRGRAQDHVPRPRGVDLAPSPPRVRPHLRGDPEARTRRPVPAPLACAGCRGSPLRV